MMLKPCPAILAPLGLVLLVPLATAARGDDRGAGLGPSRTLATRSGVRFGLWPAEPRGPSPTLFILANTIEGTLDDPYFRQSGNVLARRGYLCASVDLPCHGRERRPDEPEGLAGWRLRCERGEDVMAELSARLRAVLDHLIAEGMTDPGRVAACGTSRGGFAALHFAIVEPRVRCVAAFAPAIDLGALREFRGAEAEPMVRRLDLGPRADDLAGRPLWLTVGDRDERIGTDLIIHFARRVTGSSLARRRPALVDLHVVSEPKGHTTPAGAPGQAADWIDLQISK
jgi:dienelactone hydrolase